MAGRKVIVFMGSVREGRICKRVVTLVTKHLEKQGLDVTLFDPEVMEFPLLRQPLHFMPDQSLAPQWLREANTQISEADGFVVVMPEYNCSLPPALSNMMDHFSPESYKHRPVGICTYSVGQLGGARAAALVRPFLSELRLASMPYALLIPTAQTLLSDDGHTESDVITKNAEKFARELNWYIQALRNQKDAAGLP